MEKPTRKKICVVTNKKSTNLIEIAFVKMVTNDNSITMGKIITFTSVNHFSPWEWNIIPSPLRR